MIADFKSIRRKVDAMQTNDEQGDEQRDSSIETMSSWDFSDDDSIEVVAASVDLFTVLGIEVAVLQ